MSACRMPPLPHSTRMSASSAAGLFAGSAVRYSA